MVFVIPSPEPDTLHAYLTIDLTKDQLKKIHEDFEYGSQAHIQPCMCLHIHDFRERRGKSYAEIRRLVTAHQAGGEAEDIDEETIEVITEDDEGDGEDDEDDGEWEDEPEPQDFLLIDEWYTKVGSIWYIQSFATPDEVSSNEAVSTTTLWELAMVPMKAPSTRQNYEIGNMTIVEDLVTTGVKLPFRNGAQKQVWTLGRGHHEGMLGTVMVNVLVGGGEWEESVREEDRKVLYPMPELVGRVTERVARKVGVVPGWVVPNEPKWFVGLEGREVKEGNVVLSQCVDLDVKRPPY